MRLLHTSDWHLGQEFHGFPREHEHERFLAWLEDRLEDLAADALVVAGDIYDSQNPPVAAQRQLYRFISRVRRRLPGLDIVLVGGNHDSAGRLEAPGPLLHAFGVQVVGSLPRGDGGRIDIDRLAVPLRNCDGEVAALCAAVPFLRPSDLPPPPEDCAPEESLPWGVRQVYAEALEGAAARCEAGQALIATGHCYMTGCALSELSERRILGGNQHALPADIFPADLAYVALGHLHKAQQVGGRPNLRYSGSPLPLSVTERDYVHQVLLVDLAGSQARITPVPVPRPVPVLRVPARGPATAEHALAVLRALTADPGLPRQDQPYLDVVIAADGPQPSLRRDVEEALSGKGVRLARLKLEIVAGEAAEPVAALPDLDSLHPEEVFRRCWRRSYDGEPGDGHLAAFRELLEGLESGAGEAP